MGAHRQGAQAVLCCETVEEVEEREEVLKLQLSSERCYPCLYFGTWVLWCRNNVAHSPVQNPEKKKKKYKQFFEENKQRCDGRVGRTQRTKANLPPSLIWSRKLFTEMVWSFESSPMYYFPSAVHLWSSLSSVLFNLFESDFFSTQP